jgi:hypothetical protein
MTSNLYTWKQRWRLQLAYSRLLLLLFFFLNSIVAIASEICNKNDLEEMLLLYSNGIAGLLQLKDFYQAQF